MKLETLILSGISQKKTFVSFVSFAITEVTYDTIYIWNLIYGTNEPAYRKKKKLTNMKNRLVVVKGEGEGVGWMGSLGLLHLESISNEVLLYSTGNYI